MLYRSIGHSILASYLLLGTTAAGQDQPVKSGTDAGLSGWQIEAFMPSNMPPALSWDCFELPRQANDFARSYVDMVYVESGCEIIKAVAGDDLSASVTLQCPGGIREFAFKKTTDKTMGIQEIEIESGGRSNHYLTSLKQCDATVEFDCSDKGRAAWRASRPPQAVNYACEERKPPADEPEVTIGRPDFGFPNELQTFKVALDREGENIDNALPEQCNWYQVDGEELCYTPTDLEQFVDSPHALSLAEIAIELRVGEREFSGPDTYCSDVKALAAQMPWMKDVKCAVEAE